MSAIVCSVCGVEFSIPDRLYASLHDSHKTFFCPSGHQQYFSGESRIELLERRTRFLQEQLRSRDRDIAQLERRRRAARAWATRYKRAEQSKP